MEKKRPHQHRRFRRFEGLPRGQKAIANETCQWRTIARLCMQLRHSYEMSTARRRAHELTLDECKRFIVENDSVDNTLVLDIFTQLRKERYSFRYSLKLIGSIVRSNDRIDRAILYRLSGGSKRKALEERSRGESSRNSDGVLVFDKNEFQKLFAHVVHALTTNAVLVADSSASPLSFHKLVVSIDERENALFLYVFYMLAVTGKRLSDIANLTTTNLRDLKNDGLCVIVVQKTQRLGRVEISEILRPDEFECEQKVKAARQYIDLFLRWSERNVLSIPFDKNKTRRHLDRTLTILYKHLFGKPRKRGLSFHALRRAYAGYRYLQGCPLTVIQESLEHTTREMTNRYVNRCIFNLNRTKGDDKNP